MTIIQDTREQEGKHKYKQAYFDSVGIGVVRSKLYVGDYSRLDDLTICIDTKKDVLELAGNVCGKQHERFKGECIRAMKASIRLVVLIEEAVDLSEWTSPRRKDGTPLTQVKSGTLAKALATMSAKYGVVFEFCERAESGRRIVEILSKEKTTILRREEE